MAFFSEHRLLHYIKPITGTRYSTRIAEDNAQAQETTRAQQLLKESAPYQSYIDPTTGKDSRADADGNLTQQGNLTTQTILGPLTTQQNQANLIGNITEQAAGQPLVDQYGNATSAGRLNQAQTIGNTPNAVNYNTQTGVTTDLGFKDLSSGAGGKAGALGINPNSGIVDTSTWQWHEASGESREAFENRRATQESINTEKMKQQQIKQQSERGKITSGTGQEIIPPPPSASSAGAGAAFANLPPEAQFLVPYLTEFQETMQTALQENAQMTQGMLTSQGKTYDAIDDQLSQMQEGYRATTEAMQGLLEDAKLQNDENLAKQQKAQEERLAWDEYKIRRDLTKQKADAHDSMVAQIALAGGFGQDAGMREVMESDSEFDSKLQDLAVEFSYAKTDLAAKFSGLYMENQNNYTNGTVANMKELQSALERIGMQGISNAQKRQEAEQNLLSKAWETQTNLRTTLATQNLNVAGQMAGMIQKEKANKLAQQQLEDDIAWREYVFEQEMDYKRDALASGQSSAAADDIERMQRQNLDRMDRERNRIASRVDGDKIIQEADSVDVRFDNMNSVYERAVERQEQYDNGEINKKSMNATDQTLINTFNKTLDETSVVREGEYERSIEGLAFMEKMEAKLRKINEGGVLTPDERKEIFEVTQTLQGSWQAKKNERYQRYYNQIDSYNIRSSDEYQLTPEEFGLPSSRTTTQDRSDLDGYLPDGYSSPHSEGNPFSGGGDGSIGSQVVSMGRVTQDYRTKLSPSLYPPEVINAWQGTHKGLDVAIPQGTKLPSVVGGKVIEVGYNGGWGGTIVIEDANGAQHRFSHLQSFNVKAGDEIQAGQIIGLSGGGKGTKGAGTSTGPHLDYRIKVGGKYVDPMQYSLNKTVTPTA